MENNYESDSSQEYLNDFGEENNHEIDISHINAICLNKLSSIVAEFGQILGFVSNNLTQFHEGKLLRNEIMSAELAQVVNSKLVGVIAILEKNTMLVREKMEEYLIEWQKLLENSLYDL